MATFLWSHSFTMATHLWGMGEGVREREENFEQCVQEEKIRFMTNIIFILGLL
jgi:hypothetical protein